MVLRKLLHRWYPRRFCARDAPLVFQDNSVYCPVCGRLLAYRYPAKRSSPFTYEVHVCYPEAYEPLEVLSAANRNAERIRDPHGINETIQLIHTRSDDEIEGNDELEHDENEDTATENDVTEERN